MTFFTMLVEDFQMIHWLEFGFRIVLACICGAVVGAERSERFKDAGIRTHSIICCTAALLIIISKYGFADLSGIVGTLYFPGIKGADPARIASSAVSGASFLGVGIIYRDKNYLTRGLTTAAGVWSVCAIGLAIGSGFFGIGIFTAIVIRIMKYCAHHFGLTGDAVKEANVVIQLNDAEHTPEAFCDGMSQKLNMVIQETNILSSENGVTSFELEMKLKDKATVSDIKNYAAQYGTVQSIRVVHES